MPWTKVKNIGAIAGSILTIISLGGLLYTWYYNYSETTKKKEKEEIRILISEIALKTVTTETSSEITQTKELLDSLQEVISNIKEGSEYFAIGFRGDGSGKMWYRDKFGKVFNVYYSDVYGMYYYINEQGLAVYI